MWVKLMQMIDARSTRSGGWNVAEHEDHAIAADLVRQACLRQQISKGRRVSLMT